LRLNQLFGKHVALKEEITVVFEAVEGLFEGGGRGGDRLHSLGGEVVDVLVEGFAGFDFTEDARLCRR
jgi:hypothetical protein